jgi:sulfate permease, SulP family
LPVQGNWRHRVQVGLTMLGAGLIIGVDNLAFCVAIAALMFTGPLAPGLELAVTAALISTLVCGVVLAVFSRITCHIGHVQDLGVAVLAQALAAMVASHALPEDVRVATALAIVTVATLVSGFVLLVTGWFGWGRIARYFPQPVLSAFLAGSGWLLVIGSLSVASGLAMADLVFPSAWSAEAVRLAAPAVLFALLLWAVLGRTSWPGALVLVLFLGVCTFHLALVLLGIPISEAQAAGWLPQATTGGATFPDLTAIAPLVDWGAVASALPAIGTVAFLTLMGALVSTSALEAVTGEDTDLDRELRQTGLANLAIAGVAGPPAFSGFVSTLMALRSGVTTRGTGLVMAAVLLLGLVAAGTILAAIPVFAMAGLILYLGCDLLMERLVRTRRSYGQVEWLIVVVIVVIIVVFGFLAGILAGLVIACLIFVWSYARVPILRRSGSLADLSSTLARSPADTALLRAEGARVAVVVLQGYLFFGTAERLREQVRNRLQDVGAPPLLRLVLDFRHVVGLDSAAAAQLDRIASLVARHGAGIVLSGCSGDLRLALARAVPGLRASFTPDLDEALEQAEDAVLGHLRPDGAPALPVALSADPQDRARLDRLFAALPPETVAAGTPVMQAGDEADALVFLEQGRVVVRPPESGPDGPRLRVMAAGAILGDIGLALQSPRTADVVAATDVVLRRLTRDRLAAMERDDPSLALAVQRMLARALAERIVRDERSRSATAG